ncbi:hypothetical protein Goklo_006566 [Gossypium klotzschianum]|uniref:DUF7745 domain-containing protein n=1 Tax=Gossypium klotzschianum TaxID=34286 RepID=A0A7J8VI03_9ROSI|nr:hypothetical protein [Gossypium klotzschianum]
MLKAMVHFRDPTYRCFTFNEVDMVLTIEEYSTILHYDFRDSFRLYWKRSVDFWGSLANMMGVPIDMVKARLKDKNGLCIS